MVDPLEEARILDFRASLLGDQGRFEQAAELLDVVIDIYDDLREPAKIADILAARPERGAPAASGFEPISAPGLRSSTSR